MQTPLPTGQKLLPAAPEAQIAFINGHSGLNEFDRDVLIHLIESRMATETIVTNNTRIKALHAQDIDATAVLLEAPFKWAELQRPRLAFAKLAYKALFWVSGLPREVAAGWRQEAKQEHADDINLTHMQFARFFDRADHMFFDMGQEKFSATGKQIWNELADITRRESHPRYSAAQIAHTPTYARTSPKSLGHS